VDGFLATTGMFFIIEQLLPELTTGTPELPVKDEKIPPVAMNTHIITNLKICFLEFMFRLHSLE
jgi:hypothetical protein